MFKFKTDDTELPTTDVTNPSLCFTNNVRLQYNSMQQTCHTCVISSFHCKVDENCALLEYYAVSSGNFLLTFLDNLVQKHQ